MASHPIERRPPLSVTKEFLESVALPASDLTEAHMEHFFYCGPLTAPTGLVGVELHGNTALLRSLAVTNNQRAAGVGSALIDHAEAHARVLGARSMFLLTTTAEAFFSRRGYTAAHRESAPSAIRSTPQFADICPASSAFMVKGLVQEP